MRSPTTLTCAALLASVLTLATGCASGGSAGPTANGAPARVTGKVYYLARIATPKDAPLTVKVVDMTDSTKPKVIGSQSLKVSAVPANFDVKVNPKDVIEGRIYQVQAELGMGSGVWRNGVVYPVLTGGSPSYAEIVVGPGR